MDATKEEKDPVNLTNFSNSFDGGSHKAGVREAVDAELDEAIKRVGIRCRRRRADEEELRLVVGDEGRGDESEVVELGGVEEDEEIIRKRE